MTDNKEQKDKELPNNELASDDIEKKPTNRLVKFIFILIGFILLVLCVGMLYLKTSIKPNKIIEEVNHKIALSLKDVKTEIKINGVGTFSLFPLPHITVNDVILVNVYKNGFYFDGNVKKIKIFPSIIQLFYGQIIPQKINVDGARVKFRKSSSVVDSNSAEVPDIFSLPSNFSLVFSDSNISVNGLTYNREFENISFDVSKNGEKVNFYGNLFSNKYPLNLSGFVELLETSEEKKEYNSFASVIDINSQAFTSDFKISGKVDFSSVKVISNINAEALQLFIKTIFNDNSFFYKRVKDNTSSKISLIFDYKNSILDVVELSIISKNIDMLLFGSLNFNEYSKSFLNISVNNMKLSALLSKASHNNSKIEQKDIYIFNKDNYKFEGENKRFLANLDINFGAGTIEIDNFSIKDLVFNLNYSNGSTSFTNFNFIINDNSTYFNLEKDNTLSFSGDDLRNFFKNNLKNIDKKIPFSLSSKFSLDNYGKILFTDIKGSAFDTNFSGDVEMHYSNIDEVHLIAVNATIDDLDMENLLYRDLGDILRFNALKSETLFLSDYITNNYYKVNIKNIKYKDWSDTNYNFSLILSNKYLFLHDLNLNDKIIGSSLIDVRNQVPKIDTNLHIKNYEFKDKIDFIDLIFRMPSMDDFSGNLMVNLENVKYLDSNIGKLSFDSALSDGIYSFKTLKLEDGFGGKCDLSSGFFDTNFNKKFNLVLKDCILSLEETLYLATNKKNVSGLLGVGVVLFAEGTKLDEFTKNFLVKISFTGSAVQLNGFGIKQLVDDLFKAKNDIDLLNTISHTTKINSILLEENNSTMFEKINGKLQFSKKTGGTIDFLVSSQLYNGKVAGSFDLFKDYAKLKLNSNFTILTGSIQRLIPLTISVNLSGNTNDIQYGINAKQVREYLSILQEEKGFARTNNDINKNANNTTQTVAPNDDLIELPETSTETFD